MVSRELTEALNGQREPERDALFRTFEAKHEQRQHGRDQREQRKRDCNRDAPGPAHRTIAMLTNASR